MQVRFERTGQRRYAVAVLRSEHGDLRMEPAPGYSDLIPHDLVHMVVEEQFGLRDAIFGQLAAGGNAGTFVPTEELRTKAWARQVERRNRSTGSEMERSEALAAQVYPRWLRHSGHLPDSHYVPRDLPPTDLSDTDLARVLSTLCTAERPFRSDTTPRQCATRSRCIAAPISGDVRGLPGTDHDPVRQCVISRDGDVAEPGGTEQVDQLRKPPSAPSSLDPHHQVEERTEGAGPVAGELEDDDAAAGAEDRVPEGEYGGAVGVVEVVQEM